MNDLNTVTLSGQLVRDPEFVGENGSVARFTIAAERSYRKAGEEDWTKEVAFVNCTAFNGLAKRMRKLHGPDKDNGVRPDRLTIVGRLELNRWTNGEGEKREQLRVIAEDATAEGFFRPAAELNGSTPEPVGVAASETQTDDDIPF